MGRDFKFRAWDNKNKEWLMGYELPNLGGFSLTGETVLFGEWGHCFNQFLFNRDGKEPNDLIIEQFTGLKDKNGKEVYEGDIFQDSDITVKIIYSESSTAFLISGLKDEWDDYLHNINLENFDKIGNIHENPELLNF